MPPVKETFPSTVSEVFAVPSSRTAAPFTFTEVPAVPAPSTVRFDKVRSMPSTTKTESERLSPLTVIILVLPV